MIKKKYTYEELVLRRDVIIPRSIEVYTKKLEYIRKRNKELGDSIFPYQKREELEMQISIEFAKKQLEEINGLIAECEKDSQPGEN